jgi:hypothetical protein
MRFLSPSRTLPLLPCYGDDDPPKGDDPPKEGEPALVQLSQPRLDELLDKAYARGAKNSKDGQEAQALRKELDELRAVKVEFDQLKAGQGAATGVTQDQLDELKDQLKTEYDTKVAALTQRAETAEAGQADTVGQFRSKDLERQVVSAASKLGAKDADDVFALMDRAGTFEYDEDSDAWVVKDDKGRVRLDVDSDMQPYSVDKTVAEYLEAKPHLKRSSGRTGGGGPGADNSEGTPAVEASNLGSADVLKHGGHAVLDSLRTGRPISGG